jgi:penicillin-binding protein 2
MLIQTDSDLTEAENETSEQKTPIQIWLAEHNLKENISAEDAVAQLLVNNNKYLSSLFSNSKIRRLSYEFIIQKGVENIKLNEFSFIQDEEYENIKRDLNALNEEITMDTSAKDDFVILTMKNSIDNLLQTVYQGNEKIMPGAILIERLKEIYPTCRLNLWKTVNLEYLNIQIRKPETSILINSIWNTALQPMIL